MDERQDSRAHTGFLARGCRRLLKRGQWLALIGALLAACAEAPPRQATIEAFRDTRQLEVALVKGKSTRDDIKRVLGEPTGSGAMFLARAQQGPEEIWLYQDIELTDMKSNQGQLDLKIRQQILLVFVRGELFDGFMWFSNADAATGWVKDSLRAREGR